MDYGILSALYLLWFFGVIHPDFEDTLYIMAGFEILNFLGMFFIMFKAASMINEITSE